jgi:hypothetical protein
LVRRQIDLLVFDNFKFQEAEQAILRT